MNQIYLKLLTTLVLLSGTILANAYDFEVDGIYYSICSDDNTSCYVTSADANTGYTTYTGSYSGDVVIPDSVTYNGVTYQVAEIGNQAFYGCINLTSVKLPESIKMIKVQAFQDCISLTSVNIPKGVQIIGYGAFQYCYNLKSVTIQDGVIAIRSFAFDGCDSLRSVTIPSSIRGIQYGAFADCMNLDTIFVEAGNKKYDSRNNCNAIIETASNKLVAGCNNTIIPDGVKSIDKYAFEGLRITSINIPNSVTYIDDYAFWWIDLSTVTIPASVTYIGDKAFGHSDLPNYVKCLATEPPTIKDLTFYFVTSNTSKTTLYVLPGCKAKYQAATGWSNFNIVEDESLTGIASVNNDHVAKDDTYYNISGQRVGSNAKGITIHNGKKYILNR